MKKIVLAIIVSVLGIARALAQGEGDTTTVDTSYVVWVSISDPNQFVINPGAPPTFTDPAVNTILSTYTIHDFSQAFPASRFEYMRNIWQFVCNSPTLGSDLVAHDAVLFPYYEVHIAPIMIGCTTKYTPNDPLGVTSGNQDYLKYIGAEEAWGVTHGDPNVIIGVNDTWLNTGHPDLAGQIVNAFPNVYPSGGEIQHGTQVSGFVAAKTDNSNMLNGIGFNCRINFRNDIGDPAMLALSSWNPGNIHCAVLNASWTNGAQYNNATGTTPLDLSPFIIGQGVYDEVYENGTTAVVAAGNAWDPNRSEYRFPASYNHNISVSSLGWMNPTGGATGFCQKDIHDFDAYAATKSSHTHNSAVDICAGGIAMTCLSYDPAMPHDIGWNEAWGTSYASPQVAGVVGLMKSVNPCLTPYQIEYILKKTAYNVNALNPSYAGLLGAGRIQADQAVCMAKSFSCNDKATQTMSIDGIDITHICVPGHVSTSVNPQLKVIMGPGSYVAPLSYHWYALPGNTTTLSSIYSPTPDINSSTGNNVAYYRVVVTDNSTIPKVASKIIKVKLTTDNTPKLMIRDSYADMGDEPNSQSSVDPRQWNIWLSSDLWNRYPVNDGKTAHQTPTLSSTTGTTNYANVKIRNIGCAAFGGSGSAVHIYFTKASTGEKWEDDWKGWNIVGLAPSGAEITPSGGLSIPYLDPGHSIVRVQAWTPTDPYSWDPYSGGKAEMCLLARIEEPGGMTIPEISDVSINVINNRRIATRNTSVINLDPTMIVRPKHQIDVASTATASAVYNLQIIGDNAINPHFSGDPGGAMYVTAYLGDLYDAWMAGGGDGTYYDRNELAKTVTFDGASTLELRHITIEPTDRFPVNLEFAVKDSSIVDSSMYRVHFRLMNTDGTGASTDVHGNFTFEFRISDTTVDTSNVDGADSIYVSRHAINNNNVAVNGAYTIYPNPVSDNVNISYFGDEDRVVNLSVSDLSGKILVDEKDITIANGDSHAVNIASLLPGSYFVTIRDNKGNVRTSKVVKLK